MGKSVPKLPKHVHLLLILELTESLSVKSAVNGLQNKSTFLTFFLSKVTFAAGVFYANICMKEHVPVYLIVLYQCV